MAQANQRKLYIGNLPKACTVKRLEAFLKPALRRAKATIQLCPSKSRQGKGYALVSIPDHCVDRLLDFDGKVLDSCKVTVKRDNKTAQQLKREREREGVSVSNPHQATADKQVPFCYDIIDCGVQINTNREHFSSIISTAVRCGVRKLILLGTDVATSMDAQEISTNFPDTLYYTAGFHPCHAKNWTEDVADLLREVAATPHCVALGPCGFDLSDQDGLVMVEEQLLAFQAQIVCAAELRKPLIVHQMGAHVETLGQISTHGDSLDQVAIKCDPLCSVTDLDDYLAAGCHIFLYGFPHPTSMELWLKQASNDAEKKAAILPRLLLTSNIQCRRGSDLAPFRLNTMTKKASALFKLCKTVQNEPTSLPAIVETAAMFLKMKPEALAVQLKQNAETFFDLQAEEQDENSVQGDGTHEEEESDNANVAAEEVPKDLKLWWVVGAAAVLVLAHVCVFLLPWRIWS